MPEPTLLPPLHGILPILDATYLEQIDTLLPDTVARHLNTLPISWVQLRAKGDPDQTHAFMLRWQTALRQHAPGIRVMLNDRVSLVETLQAAGVHVGQEDTTVETCRQLLTPGRLIGLSTHSLEEIRQAETWKVDYVGFGPVFATLTKKDARAVQGVTALAEVCRQTRLPVVAIGGITLESLPAVAAAGAAGAAMISALWQKDWEWRMEEACRRWEQGHRTLSEKATF
ncbi:MAG: thiamine phosphate synthase [Magnetococcales bacterium]|nr:thiamine phosphate synthase [Magnetococcales bacterium]